MKRSGRLAAATAALLGAATFSSAGPAGAQDAVTPVPCDGKLVLTDAKGDASYSAPLPVGPDDVAAPNHDITGAFFTYRTVDGKPQLRANIVVANLDTTPSETEYGTGVRYDLGFTTSDFYFAYATMVDGAFKYEFGYYNRPLGGAAPEIPQVGRPDPGQLETVETTGQAVPGPNGVISIDIPVDQVLDFKVGDKLTEVDAHSMVANADENIGTTLTAFYSDVAPDEGTKEWTVAECAEAPAEPAGGTTNVGTGEVPAAPTQNAQTQQPAAPPAQSAQSQSGGSAPQPAKSKAKSVAAKKKACQKKARKIKNKSKRKKALKRCSKIKR